VTEEEVSCRVSEVIVADPRKPGMPAIKDSSSEGSRSDFNFHRRAEVSSS